MSDTPIPQELSPSSVPNPSDPSSKANANAHIRDPKPDAPEIHGASLNRREFLGVVGAFATATATSTTSAESGRADEPKSAPVPAPSSDRFIERSKQPPNYETRLEQLDSYITPENRLFLRSHFSYPEIDDARWILVIDGLVEHPLKFTLADLKALPQVTHTAVLQCSGNGRSFFSPPIKGVTWDRGAVGNAVWSGVPLSVLLEKAGVRPEARHIQTASADRAHPPNPNGENNFLRSLPIARAGKTDTLIALAINDAPLTKPHGGPARLVVPGWVGNHWIKWITRITLSAEEAPGPAMQKSYRMPIRTVPPGGSVTPDQTLPVTTLNVKSIISSPARNAPLTLKEHWIEGFAWTGENRRITQVEVSTDNGVTFQPAELHGPDRPHAWRPFRYRWLPTQPGNYVLQARATDNQGNTQPVAYTWNPAGYLHNAIDRIPCTVKA